MLGIKEFLTNDHRECDEVFAQMEEAVANGSEDSISKFESFHTSMIHHFDMEEKVMFPAFEKKIGMTEGPTQVMRNEHEQMRRIMTQMVEAIGSKDNERFFGLSETLMMLTQQHNMKEEQMLYTMAEQHLGTQGEAIVEEMQAV
ncbi:MAG: hemerythrin HHE cation-binding protein [Arcobacter sp.]|nr:MAG: hemerythrin HHE cation-binding protein [Arcobacter sp.]